MRTALLILILSAGLVQAAEKSECEFMWNVANNKAATASTKKDFANTALLYQKLINSGVYNEHSFHNLGTAFLLAENFKEAERALLRAERYAGNKPDIENNLLAAVKGAAKQQDAELPWYRIPLFWHFNLGITVRISIAVFAFAFFWIGMIIRRFSKNNFAETTIAVSLLATALFCSSVLTSIWQEHNDRQQDFIAASKNAELK